MLSREAKTKDAEVRANVIHLQVCYVKLVIALETFDFDRCLTNLPRTEGYSCRNVIF